MDKLREQVALFMEGNPVLEKLEGDDWYKVEDGLVDLLKSDSKLQWLTYREREQFCHLEDVRMELINLGRNATQEQIDNILYEYEDMLGDSEEWHYILQEAIHKVLGDEENGGE